jgi:hypothetical protein
VGSRILIDALQQKQTPAAPEKENTMEKKHITLIVTIAIAIVMGFVLTAVFAAGGTHPMIAVLYTISVGAGFSGVILIGIWLVKMLLRSMLILIDEHERIEAAEARGATHEQTKEPEEVSKPAEPEAKAPVKRTVTKAKAKVEKKAEPEKKAPAKKTSKKTSERKSSKK